MMSDYISLHAASRSIFDLSAFELAACVDSGGSPAPRSVFLFELRRIFAFLTSSLNARRVDSSRRGQSRNKGAVTLHGSARTAALALACCEPSVLTCSLHPGFASKKFTVDWSPKGRHAQASSANQRRRYDRSRTATRHELHSASYRPHHTN